jgi:hypothetical protein
MNYTNTLFGFLNHTDERSPYQSSEELATYYVRKGTNLGYLYFELALNHVKIVSCGKKKVYFYKNGIQKQKLPTGGRPYGR